VRRHAEKREAQRVLAREVTRLVHGDAATREAEEISAAFFSGDLERLTERQLAQACQGMPKTVLSDADLRSLSIVELLTRAGLASRSAADESSSRPGPSTSMGSRSGTPTRGLTRACALRTVHHHPEG